MSNYILGGWSQSTRISPLSSFSHTMYGMITNLEDLRSGRKGGNGWGPDKEIPPTGSGKKLWTYGGGGAEPKNMPSNEKDINKIVEATVKNGWDGVDFDNESDMNVDNLIETMRRLRSTEVDSSNVKPSDVETHHLETSYTFIAGEAYNNPGDPELDKKNGKESVGERINANVQAIAKAGVADRFVLMCYASSMWSMDDITKNVGPAIDRTMDYVSEDRECSDPKKKIVLALTSAGLSIDNLYYFLDQVTSRSLGGLFIWNYQSIKLHHMMMIEEKLGITSNSRLGIVSTLNGLNLRKDPFKDDNIICTLRYGSQVKILGNRGEWLSVESGDETGFVHGSYVCRLPSTEAQKAE